ncbi:MAG TPA: ATP-binding protein, partial [Polyangiaceae bacterium]|nr:ATP-binding protein [Polyangiaceae bacterium]
RLRGKSELVTRDDLVAGCNGQSSHKLTALARKLPASHVWEDLIVPPQAATQLAEICAQMRHRRRVYEDWGFGRLAASGRGLCALFYGPSGVGKTLGADVIAHELGLDAYRIDLSSIVNKYIGETEKNLGRLFEEAETANAMLFFDEADALFGKRTEVKDAHDRYANIETNYLLQRMEDFDGLVILASNLRKNIDDGFFRRMHFAVEFTLPDVAHRYRIWRHHLPRAAPIAEGVDLDFLATRFAIPGGSIRNIVLNAAFLAAEDSDSIHMQHLMRATRREYEKLGRPCTAGEFAPYQEVLLQP